MLLGSLLACETVVDVPLPTHEPRLVLNALLYDQWTPYIYLSRSRGRTEMLPDSVLKITDASCYLFADGQPIDTLLYQEKRDTVWQDSVNFRIRYESGYRREPMPLVAGTQYRIEATAPGFPPIQATSYLPHFPEPVGVEIDQQIGRDENGLPLARVRIQLEDPPGEDNYFQLSVQIVYSHPDSLDSLRYFYMSPYLTEGALRQELEEYVDLDDLLGSGGSLSFIGNYYNDQGNDGQSYDLEMVMYQPIPTGQYYPFFRNEVNFPAGQAIPEYVIRAVTVQVSTVSKDFYLYETQLALHQQNQSLNLSSLIGEPVLMHSNVENGYGIFGLTAWQSFRIPY